ncbi:hypothetical protein SSP24_77440 [Streptomyces spinoverrucosus]|uniref:Uncharacterized protein n=1 Tax=Streptomyces spinoverrucosus TaxID=284043 RepID=A0A4Y3VWL5_9ACTN|nr:hypothetical protein SSP24_77440 [Streptomyces spinoverrucosus]GHB69269.1 hypothetical protein GCM10010397_44610 [Streptomyces spinoverrucosus]
MLSRANNVSIRFEPIRPEKFALGSKTLAWLLRISKEAPPSMGRAWLRIGREEYPGGVVSEETYLKQEQLQRHEPILMIFTGDHWYW